MRSGLPLSHVVPFPSGAPDGDVTWSVINGAGTIVVTDTITPQAGDVSATIVVPVISNTLPEGTLYEVRDLVWFYTTGGMTVSDEFRFTLEGRVPFGARPDGVRNKLGVSRDDLSDDEIELMKAFLWFENDVGAERLDALSAGTPVQQLIVANGIEAWAALSILPTLQVRIAASESSGTNEYARGKIDWASIEAELDRFVDAARVLIDPTYDDVGLEGSLFVVATRDNELFPGG